MHHAQAKERAALAIPFFFFFWFFLNCSTVDLLFSFQVYKIVIQHLNTLWNDHFYKSNNHLSPHEVIKILLNIFLTLYITSLWLIYFMTGGFYLLIPFTYFATTPSPSFLYLWICFHFLFFVCSFWFLDSTKVSVSEIMQYLSFSVWLIDKNPVSTFWGTWGYDFNMWIGGGHNSAHNTS